MWLVALAFALVLAAGGGFETWAVWLLGTTGRDFTITGFVRRHPHLSILLGLGRGGS